MEKLAKALGKGLQRFVKGIKDHTVLVTGLHSAPAAGQPTDSKQMSVAVCQLNCA